MTALPERFTHLLAAWNERDTKKIREHLGKAVTKVVEIVDPNYEIEGIGAFAKMIKEFRIKYPAAVCVRASGIDMHHDRARYAWSVIIGEKTRVDGFDAVALSRKSRKVKRVDGFFGPLPKA
jgi:hypothetical protein